MQSQRSESYVKERWNWSRTRAYELIDVAKVDDNLSAMADKTANERQAREVAKAPPEKQARMVALQPLFDVETRIWGRLLFKVSFANFEIL